jgi:hypothetical protein
MQSLYSGTTLFPNPVTSVRILVSARPKRRMTHKRFSAFVLCSDIKAMKTNPLKEGVLTENSTGIGTVSRKMVRERAVELAVINGRSAQEVSKSDWEQAKRELTGEPDVDPKDAVLESAPESERWDPLPGSTGHKVPAAPSADEDDEGRSDNERLVDEGVAGAELDQSLQAGKAAKKENL